MSVPFSRVGKIGKIRKLNIKALDQFRAKARKIEAFSIDALKFKVLNVLWVASWGVPINLKKCCNVYFR